MELGFPLERERALAGQKVDSTSTSTISMSADESVPFGALLCFDGLDPFRAQIPKSKEQLLKPLGIALRQHHCLHYEPKTPMAILRQGRVWVEAEDVLAPGDQVFIKLANGQTTFTGKAEGNIELKCAIFLESQLKGKVPIEINFLGGNK